MANSFRLLLDGAAADDKLYTAMTALEVEENADMPGAIQFSLPVSRGDDGELTYVTDSRFSPFANLAVVVTPDGGPDQCIFDGYVLSHKLHVETGTVSSTLQVFGQDASWLMNLEEKSREWTDVTDSDVAASIFGEYGITPDSNNGIDDSPSHTEARHSLMQRASDIQFLRGIARRNGKLCRVACKDKPGMRIGTFASPKLDGDPVLTLTLNDPAGAWNVGALDIEWDATRPSVIKARQATFDEPASEGVGGDVTDSGLAALGDRTLSAFSGKPVTMLLTTSVDDQQELTLRAQSVLREGGWFVRCEGETEVSRLKGVLRAGTVVQVDTIGTLHSGKYLVWSVRHLITPDAHTMNFVLVRNAVGNQPSGGLPGGFA